MLAVLKQLLGVDEERRLPVRVRWFHYFGMLAVVFFFLQVGTGILLMVYYRPSPTGAYFSTGIIMDEVRLGWLIRALHAWGAHLLVLLMFLRLARVYFTRDYAGPRQVNWVLGIGLFIVIVTAGFTGTLLPWDQRAYWYIDSARTTLSQVPGFGTMMLGVIWGGWELGEQVLLRFYVLHVGLLPWLAVGAMLLQMLVLWRSAESGLLGRDSGAPPAAATAWSDVLANLFIAVLLLGGLLLTAAVLFPPILAEPADPLAPIVDVRAPWYLVPLRQLLQGFPGALAALAVAVFLAVLLAIPALDRAPLEPGWRRLARLALGALVIGVWVALTVKDYYR